MNVHSSSTLPVWVVPQSNSQTHVNSSSTLPVWVALQSKSQTYVNSNSTLPVWVVLQSTWQTHVNSSSTLPVCVDPQLCFHMFKALYCESSSTSSSCIRHEELWHLHCFRWSHSQIFFSPAGASWALGFQCWGGCAIWRLGIPQTEQTLKNFQFIEKTLNSRNRDVSWSIFPKPVFFLYQQVETRTMSSSGTSEVMLTTWLWWKDRTRWPWPWPRLGSKPSKTIPSQTLVSKGMWWSLWRLRRTGLKHSSSNPEKICWSPQKNLGNPKSYWDKREPPKV